MKVNFVPGFCRLGVRVSLKLLHDWRDILGKRHLLFLASFGKVFEWTVSQKSSMAHTCFWKTSKRWCHKQKRAFEEFPLSMKSKIVLLYFHYALRLMWKKKEKKNSRHLLNQSDAKLKLRLVTRVFPRLWQFTRPNLSSHWLLGVSSCALIGHFGYLA